MLKRIFSIFLALSILSFSSQILHFSMNQVLWGVPQAEANASMATMDESGHHDSHLMQSTEVNKYDNDSEHCEGRQEKNANVGCCFDAHANQPTSFQSAQTVTNFRHIARVHPDIFSTFRMNHVVSKRNILNSDPHKIPPPNHVGIIVKKE